MPRMYCSLVGLSYSPYPPHLFGDVPTFATRYLHVHNDARDPSSERWNCVGKNWPVILPEIATSMSIQGSFTCRKSATWEPRLYFPSEGRHAEDFFALKNPDGFGRVWTCELGYLKGSTLPLDHQSRCCTLVKIHAQPPVGQALHCFWTNTVILEQGYTDFSKVLGATLKFLVPKGWHEASSILSTHKY